MLDKLKKHHLGIVVAPERVPALEKRLGKKFHTDSTQGVRVCFVYNEDLGLYAEYFTAEGRAKNYPPGFHHVCYSVPSMEEFTKLEEYLRKEKLGFRLTFPEDSGSDECGVVAFYKLKGVGVVEFNIDVPKKSAP